MRHDFTQPDLLDFARQLISCGKRHGTSLLLNLDDLDSLKHTNPPGGALLIWRDDPKWSLAIGQRLPIFGISNQYLGIGEGWIQLRQREQNPVPVFGFGQYIAGH